MSSLEETLEALLPQLETYRMHLQIFNGQISQELKKYKAWGKPALYEWLIP